MSSVPRPNFLLSGFTFRSIKMPLPKYVLVFWTKSKTWSILESKCVLKNEMLYNSNVVDDVEMPGNGKPPASGWPRYMARVLAVAGTNLDLFLCVRA